MTEKAWQQEREGACQTSSKVKKQRKMSVVLHLPSPFYTVQKPSGFAGIWSRSFHLN